jgi:hypothetical protein
LVGDVAETFNECTIFDRNLSESREKGKVMLKYILGTHEYVLTWIEPVQDEIQW